jgi:hypothetical protein
MATAAPLNLYSFRGLQQRSHAGVRGQELPA